MERTSPTTMGIVVFVKFVCFLVTGKNGDKTKSKMTKMRKDFFGRAIFFSIDLPIVFYFTLW